jgi:hypothetical protein
MTIETPFPDPKVTARRLGITRGEVAFVETLVAAAGHRKPQPRSVLAHLRRLLKRVEKGRESVPLIIPGLPLLVLVPIDDLPTIGMLKRTQKRAGGRRTGARVTMTVEELAQWMDAWLIQAEKGRKRPGPARSRSSTTSKEEP